MPTKPPSKKARSAEESAWPSMNVTTLPASVPAKATQSKDVPTSLEVLQNILSVLCDVRKLLGPMRPDFKEEHWYKVK